MPMTETTRQDTGAAPTGAVVTPVAGLRLTRLTLNGFKSFADPTTFTFEDAITGVVGPNGCGKSNIVDAIKWVLGERSSKSLRGKEMIDVIFAGSAKRKPSGMAAVSLTFENPIVESMVTTVLDSGDDDAPDDNEHQPEHPAAAVDPNDETPSEASEILARGRVRRPLPIDTDVVEVERRLYRDGKSQYLINGRLARLRDIRDLFMDTGIGADAYSIIEQGKVDAMLLASPTERRVIFEEAAGIAKYRQRRVEAQRKLERTEVNLTRTREQLAATERRLRFVKGQAAKARRYQELAEECDALKLAIAFDQYDDVRSRLEGLTSQLSKLERERDEAQRKLTEAEAASQDAEIARHDAAGALRRVEDERTAARHTAEQAEQRRRLAEAAIDEASRVTEVEAARAAEAAETAERIRLELAEHRDELAAIAEQLAEAERALNDASTERASLLERAAEARSLVDEARGRRTGLERERSGLAVQGEAAGERARAIAEQLDGLDHKAESLDGERERAEREAGEARDRATNVERDIASAREHLTEIESRESRLSDDRRALAERVAGLDERFARLDSRRATLDEMVRSRAGLGDAARAVLERRESGAGFEGVVGSLAELIDVDPANAGVIETSLGGDLGAIVVRSIGAMPNVTEIADLPGRVVFLPMQGLGRPADAITSNELAMLGGRVTPVLSLVRPHDASMYALLARLLGRTVLVEDLDAALMLAAGPLAGRGVRLVTKGGAVLEADGRVVAGPAGAEEASGLIARRAELASLESELESLRTALDAERTSLRNADAEAGELESARATLAHELAQLDRRLVAEQAAGERAHAEHDRLHREIAGVHEEQHRLRDRLATIEGERTQMTERLTRLDGLGGELDAEVERLSVSLLGLETFLSEASDRLSTKRVDVSRLAEQQSAARRQLGQLESQLDDAERRRDEAVRQADRASERADEHRAAFERAAAVAEQSRTDEARLDGQAGEFASEVETAESRAREVAERVRGLRDHAHHVERDWHSVESSRRELEVKRETLEERASEDLSVELAAEFEEYREVMAPGDVTPIDTADAQARVNVLRAEINKLGPVNLGAIDEETELAERNDDLIAQVADIDDARIRLATLIEKLDIASRERFGEVFERIKEEFGSRDGMFRRLFGGGRAEVRLMPLVKEVDGQKIVTDEVDLLDSGIEVIAKPPGKEPRSISQLSGGEKTLTAVALLMSIFRSKPSCFCILDEVDAALDEANVGRYCQTITQFTDMSRFIVITHNKRTMQSVDRLYGVTMQERGVSKRVAVKFDQVDDQGRIDKAAVEAEPEVIEPTPDPVAETARPSAGLRAALAKVREEQATHQSTPN